MRKIAIAILALTTLSVSAAKVKNLTVNGLFNVDKANAAAGKVLTSDANGNGTWGTLVDTSEPSPFTVDGATISYTGTVYVLGAGLTTEGLRLTPNSSPANTEACQDGTIKRDADFVYVCSGTTYKRATLSAY